MGIIWGCGVGHCPELRGWAFSGITGFGICWDYGVEHYLELQG